MAAGAAGAPTPLKEFNAKLEQELLTVGKIKEGVKAGRNLKMRDQLEKGATATV